MSHHKDGGMDIRASFASASAEGSLFNMGLTTQAVPDNTQPVRDLDVTDFAPNKNFHVEAVALPKESVQAAGINGLDSEALRGNCAAVKSDYLDTNAQIENYATEVAEHCFGAQDGRQLMDQITPGGGPTHKQAFMTMIDPTGTVGAIASAATAIHGQMSRIMDNDVLAQLDEMLTKIQEASTQQHNQQIGVDQAIDLPPPPPPGIEFDGITAQELLAFFERNVEDDPVMQAIAEVEVALDEYDRQMDYKIAHDHEVITADKIANASTAELAEMAGGDMAAAEQIEASYNADGALFMSEGLGAMPQIEYSAIDPQFASIHEIRAGLADLGAVQTAPELSIEGDLRRAASAFEPSENVMI